MSTSSVHERACTADGLHNRAKNNLCMKPQHMHKFTSPRRGDATTGWGKEQEVKKERVGQGKRGQLESKARQNTTGY